MVGTEEGPNVMAPAAGIPSIADGDFIKTWKDGWLPCCRIEWI